MLRLRSYLKPYRLMLAATIILLFAQAMLDLALPGYLADLVNTGVQLSGIESSVSEAMSQERMEQLTLFMSAEDEAAVRVALRLLGAVEPAEGAVHAQREARVVALALGAVAGLEGFVVHRGASVFFDALGCSDALRPVPAY